MKLYNVEFWDSYQGRVSMDVMARSAKSAMNKVNRLLKRECALEAYHYA